MDADEELKKKFKVFVDENNILNLSFLKEEKNPALNNRLSELVEQDIFKIFSGNPDKKYNCLVDLLSLEEAGYVPGKARGLYSRIMSDKRVNKIAIVVSNIFYKAVVNLIIQIDGKGADVRLFSKKEDALDWLKTIG